MTKSKNKKTVLGLSLFQTITLLLILFIVILSLCGIYYNKTNKKSAASTAIVVTSEVDKSAYNVDDMDVIGDFILNHEYFAADEDVLDVDIENLNKTIRFDIIEVLNVNPPLIRHLENAFFGEV